MKIVVQRVNQASVSVSEKVVGEIGKGVVVLLGVTNFDTKENADYLVKKLVDLRIFEDENGKLNFSLRDINGELLVVSNFTLYADCQHGNRPSFKDAAKPDLAEGLYNYFLEKCKSLLPVVKEGVFGSHMQVSLINDGPVTIVIEC